tara:strand:+ start:283 stop:651 length:369 start_codon:yes stop_codon:yes gene_type:complete
MKRQTKLNKYLAGPRVNRRHSAQIKRNAHNKSILADLLLHENMIRQEMKLIKAKKLEEQRVAAALRRRGVRGKISPEEMGRLDEIAAEVSPSAAAQIEKEKLEFEDVSDEILDAEFEEVKVD